jgi:hypothetical protein
MKTHRQFLDRWFAELWGARNQGIIDECVSDDCIIHGLPEVHHGREAFRGFFHAFGAAFPKVELRVDEVIESGESFAFRCTGSATGHDGRKHAFSGGGMGRIKSGRFVEAWNQFDFLALIESTGAIERESFGTMIIRESEKAKR